MSTYELVTIIIIAALIVLLVFLIFGIDYNLGEKTMKAQINEIIGIEVMFTSKACNDRTCFYEFLLRGKRHVARCVYGVVEKYDCFVYDWSNDER